jgi:hypothetical protein
MSVPRRLPVWLAGSLIVSLTGCETKPAAAPNPTPIKLSAGVALPQLGPEGTLMMFSVDYRFMEGAPNPAAKYAWVLEPAKGDPLEQPLKIKRADNLQAIVPQWRPENGPFTSHIDEIAADGTRRTVSQSHKMR